jgi:Ca-activated chloride channel family protein
MLWGAPYALLFLLGALPLILILHSLRTKGVTLRTTTLFLWERVLRERPLRTRLGWLLRKNLLLILQLLIATLLITALADPSLLHFGALSGDRVVVIDLSASMKARGPSGTRFESARKELRSVINNLATGQRMMVIGAGAQPRLLMPFTADKVRLRELAHQLTATDAPGRVKAAILMAYTFLKPGSADRVVVISDGAFDGAEKLAGETAHLRFLKVDGGKDNVGIVAFDIRRQPGQTARFEVMVHLRNFTAKAVRVPLTLAAGGKTLVREVVQIDAWGRRILIYPLEGHFAGPLEARLEIDDDLATDNRAYLAVSDAPMVRLHYIGPGNPFLSNLLRFFPHVQVTTARRWEEDAAAPQNEADVVVVDRVPVPPLKQGNFILIDTVAPNLPVRNEGKIRNPRMVAPLTKHPLTAGLNLADLTIQESMRLTVAAGATVLARSAASPLLVSVAKEKLRVLLIGFNLLSSDLPLRVAFPVLFHNAINWFKPQRLDFPGQSVQAGTPVRLYLPATDRDIAVTAPSGKRELLPARSNPLVFADTFETGFYDYRSTSREGRFAVNLFDEGESQIRSRLNLPTGTSTKNLQPTNNQRQAGFSLWPLLLVAVLILSALEAYLALRAGTSPYPVAARGFALAALVLAIVNPRIFKSTSALDVVLGVDLSRSVGQEGSEKAREILDIARRVKNPETRTGLFSFARTPEWEYLPQREIPPAEFASRLDREETDIQTALQAALAQLGDGGQRRILLISDGNENRDESSQILPLLRAQGAQVWSVPVGLTRGRNEIYLSDLTLPQQVDSAEGFEINGTLQSLRAAPARVKLLRDGVLQVEQEVQLKAGINRVSFRDSLRERGSHSYELLVESPADTLAENNLLQGVVEVKGPPKVLLLSAQKESQRFLAHVLHVQGYAVTEAAPDKQPLTLAELSSFDLLVLDNVPAFQLSNAKMESIEKYVKDVGGGLLVIGGAQSYGAGGYYRTPFERLLPVDMRPPARLDMPHVLLLFVLDKSGSMGAGPEGGTKLDLAKAAAVAAADIMNPSDQVGILGFDADWDWVLPFRPVGKGEWISDKLASLESDGGTDLYKALAEAYRAVAVKEAAIKHVLVLSDGLTDKADFRSLIQKMAHDGITVSTVSVGNDADIRLLAEIARDGKGRGYVTVDPQTIPQIFTTETLLISRDLLVEKQITPTMVTSTGPLKGIPRIALPPLYGYVLTYPKPGAEVYMQAAKDPLLVSWRYGLGRVMAFTSDLSGRWGKEWVRWQNFPQWASQLARDTTRKLQETKIRADFEPDGDAVKLVVDLFSKQGDFLNHLKLKGNITAPDRSTQENVFQQIAPGRYRAEFTPAERGIHVVTLFREGENGAAPLPVATIPYIAPYPKEYRDLEPNIVLLSRLAEETGGQMIDPEKVEEGVKRLYSLPPRQGTRAYESWWPLTGLGLLLFLGDLVLRSLPRGQ